MLNVTRYLLWIYVFAVSWDTVSLPLVGSLSRALGFAVVAVAALTTVMSSRFRKPDAIVGFSIAFATWTALSLLWTVSYEYTFPSVIRYAQLVASLCVIREFVRTREQVQTLLTSFLLGSFVPLFDLLNNFRTGTEARIGTGRFSGSSLNADGMGILLAITFPIAWCLFLQRRGIIRALSLIYVVAAPFALLLTATRGAFVAALAAVLIIPITLPRMPPRAKAAVAVMMMVGALLLTQVPQANWDRVSTIPGEILGGGSMTGRAAIWRAGLQAFPNYEVMGAGAGAYGEAVQPYYHNTRNLFAHNLYIGFLVELGIVGCSIFAALLGACAWTILRLPPPDRALWGVFMLTWLVGNLSGASDANKYTWVLFGLIAAQSGLPRTLGDPVSETQNKPVGVAVPSMPSTSYASTAPTVSSR